MQFKYIKSELNNYILTIQLNRPEKYNALCIDLVKELNQAFTNACSNTQIHAVFILGNEKAFSAGGDLKEMKLLEETEAQKRSNYVQDTFAMLADIPVPVIAFVSGICLGGGLELAMHADFIICSENAKLGLPEVKYGMIPGAGGTVKLPGYLGKADAMYYLLTGNEIPLQKALSTGLIQKVVSPESFDEEIKIQAKYFETANVDALKAIKDMVKMNIDENIKARYDNESRLFASLLTQQGFLGIEEKFTKNK